MRHPYLRAGILSCTRGGGLLEYILLLGAVVLIAVGGYKLFGTTLKSTVSDQAATVEALDEARPGDGAEGPGARGGNSTNTAANEKGVAPEEPKSARGSGPARGDGVDTSAPAGDDKMTASTKATTAIPVAQGSGVLSNAPRPDPGLGFDYGWILAGVGVVALAAVLFKGKRQATADAGAEKK